MSEVVLLSKVKNNFSSRNGPVTGSWCQETESRQVRILSILI